jgi:hypothetical protein
VPAATEELTQGSLPPSNFKIPSMPDFVIKRVRGQSVLLLRREAVEGPRRDRKSTSRLRQLSVDWVVAERRHPPTTSKNDGRGSLP